MDKLASVFELMVSKVYTREQSLRARVAQLEIMIDRSKLETQVKEIVESDFFQDLRSTEYAGFIQDDWKVNSRLTLNLGVRWQVQSVANNKYGQQSSFDPNGADNDKVGATGVITHPAKLYGKDWNNFQPRVGMAYNFHQNWVFRGGFALNTLDLWTNGLRENFEEYLGTEVLGRIRRVLRGPVRVMGRFTQALPNNWKLYVENVKDTYHASLLHAFFGTFRITRLTQGGGILVSPDGGHHASYTIDRPDDRTSTAYREQGIRSEKERYRLADPSLLDAVDEWGDGIQLQILTVFPGFVLQQINNCLAVRQVVPKGPGDMELHWTYFGFADDTDDMRRRRLKQANLVGPAGYVSMEDGCVGGFVQRGVAAAGDEVSVVNMGGEGAESQETRATEASVRGFWKAYRRYMGE